MTRHTSITEKPVAKVMPSRSTVETAFAHCESLARNHYENFPVASAMLPARIRPYVAAIYAFARTADDFADEGSLTDAERLARLEEWRELLNECYNGRAAHPVFVALAETAAKTGLPRKPLTDLLTAFTMDVTTKRFETFDDVLFYCHHSANPVGRMVLHLFGCTTPRNVLLSDAICTGLQLANFWQDVSVDWRKGRLYIPLEDCRRFGYTETEVGRAHFTDQFRQLMEFQVRRTRQFFEVGKPLVHEAPRSLRMELRLTWLGGGTILRKIESAGFNVLTKRPAITTGDKLMILTRSLLQRIA